MPISILPQFPIIVTRLIFLPGDGGQPDFGWRLRGVFALFMCTGEEMKANHGDMAEKTKLLCKLLTRLGERDGRKSP